MMGGDKRFPWLILLRRQFLIKLIMPLRGGSKRGKRRWGRGRWRVSPGEGRRWGGAVVTEPVVPGQRVTGRG